VEKGVSLDRMAIKNAMHQAMQGLFGICNGAHHLDMLKYEQTGDYACQMIMRCPAEALELLLQSLPTVSFMQERRCQFRVLRQAALLSML